MWDLIVSVPDHCLPFYFVTGNYNYETGSMTGILGMGISQEKEKRQ